MIIDGLKITRFAKTMRNAFVLFTYTDQIFGLEAETASAPA